MFLFAEVLSLSPLMSLVPTNHKLKTSLSSLMQVVKHSCFKRPESFNNNKIAQITQNVKQRGFALEDVDGITNSVDPDQTAYLGFQFAQTYLKT